MLYVLRLYHFDERWRYAAAKVFTEWLQLFLLLVAPFHGWIINEDLWLWEAIEWAQFRIPIAGMVRSFSVSTLLLDVTCINTCKG